MEPMPMELGIDVVDEGGQRSVDLTSMWRPMKIGTLRSADVCLAAAKVSRIHAVLTTHGREVHLTDMGSPAGTTVNGAQVRKTRLADGDTIGVGAAQLRVRLGERVTGLTPPHRITQEQLSRAAVESRPHPALPPEAKVTDAHRALEMRVYMGEALLDMHHYAGRRRITIGESKDSDIFLSSEGLPTESFPLIRSNRDDEYFLTFSHDMDGEVEIEGRLWTLTELMGSAHVVADPDLGGSYRLPLKSQTRALLHWAGLTFALRFVAPARAVPKSLLKIVDHHFVNTLALSVALHVTMVFSLLVYPYDVKALDQFPEIDGAIVLWPGLEAAMLPWDEPKKSERTPPRPTEKADTRPKSDHADAMPVRANRGMHPTMGGAALTDMKKRFGDALRGGLGGAPGAIARDLVGIAIGSRGTEAGSFGGMNLRGYGPGITGGFGESRAPGAIRTGGCMDANCDGFSAFVSSGIGDRAKVDTVDVGPVVFGEAIPQSMIRKVIHKNRSQIRACYERQLQRNHELEGKLGVKWVIGATGAVVRVMITEDTLHNDLVSTCVISRIEAWRFPQPAGGGIVEVNYPFVFHSF